MRRRERWRRHEPYAGPRVRFINHVTLSTGHLCQSLRTDIDDTVLARLAPWLSTALAVGVAVPLPSPFVNYKARATHEGGALLCTVLAADDTPMAIFGVVLHSRAALDVWSMLVAQFDAADGLKCPAPPWCAVNVFSGVPQHVDALEWLTDFEQFVAWAWVER